MLHSTGLRVFISIMCLSALSVVAALHWVDGSYWVVMASIFGVGFSGLLWLLRLRSYHHIELV